MKLKAPTMQIPPGIINAVICVSILAPLLLAACTKKEDAAKKSMVELPSHIPMDELIPRMDAYAPVKIGYDESLLSNPEKEALKRLVYAAHAMDEIFLRQVWAGNVALRSKLEKAASGSDEAKALLHFFRMNFGPWDRIDNNTPFIGDTPKPEGANFYPGDMTKEEFKNFLDGHPDEADAIRGFFTTIRRENGKLKAVPYSEEYRILLDHAAENLNAAADILTDTAASAELPNGVDYRTLARFLRSRAESFSSNDYYRSDMDWMDVQDNIIDVTIGPYEVYEDALFGYKASFEAFIAIRNPRDSRNLEGLKNYLQVLENNLPIPDEHKNPNRGSESPISVVDLVYAGGDTKAGVQTIAFNLPNDERVREAKGSKKVMLKNISKAKFDKILMPIAEILLDPTQLDHVDFDTYFRSTLMHEFAHGLGPGNITLQDGTKTTASRELKELYPAIEEAKADILGLHNTGFLEKDGFFPTGSSEKAYVTFLPGFFRAIRFGIHEAHGKANMMEFNFMMEKGALTFNEQTGKFSVNLKKMPEAVREMTEKLLMIEALGDYKRAKAFMDKYAGMSEQVEGILGKMNSIPIDIEPIYTAESFLSR